MIESEDGVTHDTSTFAEQGFVTSSTKDPRRFWCALDSHIPQVSGSTGNRYLNLLWWNWVVDFCDRRLTVASDNYAAMAGATKLCQEISGDEPVLGLWKKDLAVHLGWYKGPTSLKNYTDKPRVPSWSWMSLPHGKFSIDPPWILRSKWSTYEPDRRGDNFQLLYQMGVGDIDIRWHGQSLTSQPVVGLLELEGRLSNFYRSGGEVTRHLKRPTNLTQVGIYS
jgi:hypothetical protein